MFNNILLTNITQTYIRFIEMTTELKIQRLHLEMRNSLDGLQETLLHSVNLELILHKETKTRKLNEKITRLLCHWISNWERKSNFDDISKIYRKLHNLAHNFDRQWRNILTDNGVVPIDVDRDDVHPFEELMGHVVNRWSAAERLVLL